MNSIKYCGKEVALNPRVTIVIGEENLLFLSTISKELGITYYNGVLPLWQGIDKKDNSIVLIRDIERDLLPTVQRSIIATLMKRYPNTQFIVTTNSPYVLGTVRGNTVIEVNGDTMSGISECYGQSLDYISNIILKVDCSIFTQEITDIYEALSVDNIDRAEKLLNKLEAKLGHNEVPDVVQLQALIGLKKQTVLSYKILESLVSTKELTDEERASVAGSINRWVDTSDDYCTINTFFFFQPKIYWHEKLSPEDKLKSLEEQQQYCERDDLVTYPFRNQPFTAWQIRTYETPCWKNHAELNMLTKGSDIVDIGFPLEDWDKVKLFISENYHHLTHDMLWEWAKDNGYSYM
jgi:hypothetical protein